MREVDDPRHKASTYELAAHLTACLAIFLFKSGSRNQYNQNREEEQFKRNFKRLFGFDMPHGDSVKNVIEQLDTVQIEVLKHKMVQKLLQRKTFHTSRYRDKVCTTYCCSKKCLTSDFPLSQRTKPELKHETD